MAEFEEVFEKTGNTVKKMSKNKWFWIVGGGAVGLALLLNSRNQAEPEAIVMSTYPDQAAQSPNDNNAGNQLDAYTTVLDSQLQQGLESIYQEMQGNLSYMEQEQLKQQQAYAGQFSDMQRALENMMQQSGASDSAYQRQLDQMQAYYEQQLGQMATQQAANDIQTNAWYAGSIFGGESLRPDAINFGDYVVRQDSQVMFTPDEKVIEKDSVGGVITYSPNGNITYDYSKMTIPKAPQGLIESVRAAANKSTPAPKPAASNPNKMNIGGHDYSVDSKGNIYKNNKYVPASNFQYIPSEVLNRSKAVKTGG